MMQAERYITRILREHDRSLFARKDAASGAICVYRKGKRFLGPMDAGFELYYLIDSPEYVFALTDNWTTSGRPTPWGGEVVLARLKEIDLWNHEKYLDEVDAENERVEQSRKRDISNNIEAFCYDFRRDFQRATNDINTSTLDMSDQKRRKRDGNREQNERYK